MDVQRIEYEADLRVKFASINGEGGHDHDAHAEYEVLFPHPTGKLMEDWSYQQVEGWIETRFEHARRAWVLAHDPTGTQMAAVEHETGMELLVAIGGGLEPGAAAAIVAGVTGLWRQWQEARASQVGKDQASLGMESVTERFPSGRIRRVDKLEIRQPLEDELVTQLVQEALAAML